MDEDTFTPVSPLIPLPLLTEKSANNEVNRTMKLIRYMRAQGMSVILKQTEKKTVPGNDFAIGEVMAVFVISGLRSSTHMFCHE